jgi:hypothetical protein
LQSVHSGLSAHGEPGTESQDAAHPLILRPQRLHGTSSSVRLYL